MSKQFYDIVLKLTYKEAVYEFIKENVRIDISNEYREYKRESVFCIFKEELELNNIKKESTKDISVIIYNLPESLDYSVTDDCILIIESKILKYKKSKIEYSLIVSADDEITIAINNINDVPLSVYTLTVSDLGIEYVTNFKQSVTYKAKSKNLNILIKRLLNGVVLNQVEENVVLNDYGDIHLKDEYSIEKYKPYVTSLFKDGLEDRDLNLEINKKNSNTKVNVTAVFTKKDKIGDNYVEIYPAVEATYKQKLSYSYKSEIIDGVCEYIATISGNAKAMIRAVKAYAESISFNVELEAKARYVENNEYKIKNVTKRLDYNLDFYKYIMLNNSTKSYYIDTTTMYKDLSNQNSSSIKEILTKASLVSDKLGFLLFDYKIKSHTVSSNSGNVKDRTIIPFFTVKNGIINEGESLKIKILLSDVLYTNTELFYSGPVESQRKIVTKDMTDSIIVKNQSKKTITTLQKYKVNLYTEYCLNGDIIFQDTNGYKEASIKPTLTKTIKDTIVLTNNKQSQHIDLTKYLSDDEFSDIKRATVSICAKRNDLLLNGTLLKNGETRTITLLNTSDKLIFVVKGIPISVNEREYVDGDVATIKCNGVNTTYFTSLKGKLDFNGTSKPIHVPSYATDINIDTQILNIKPHEASNSVFFEARNIANKNHTTLTLQSNYTSLLPTTPIFDKSLIYGKTFIIKENSKRSESMYLDNISDGEYYLNMYSDKDGVELLYPKEININNDNRTLLFDIITTSSINSTWNVCLDPFYFYKDSNEYYTFNESYECVVENGEGTVKYNQSEALDSVICITNGNLSYQKVSGKNGLPLIEEDICIQNNVYYTKYNNIYDVRISDYNVDIKSIGSNYIVFDKSSIGKKVKLTYKVSNSFNYTKTSEDITFNLSENIFSDKLNVYTSKRLKLNIDINPKNTGINKGVIFINYDDQILNKALIFENKSKRKILYVIEIFDIHNNPYTENSKTIVTDDDMNTLDCKFNGSGRGFFYTERELSSVHVKDGDINITINREDFL